MKNSLYLNISESGILIYQQCQHQFQGNRMKVWHDSCQSIENNNSSNLNLLLKLSKLHIKNVNKLIEQEKLDSRLLYN